MNVWNSGHEPRKIKAVLNNDVIDFLGRLARSGQNEEEAPVMLEQSCASSVVIT